MSAKTALVLLHEGVEEMEFVAPVDILRRGGVEVTVASCGPRLSITGRNAIQIKADLLLADALYSPQAIWDLLVIPGGPGVGPLRKNPLALEAVRRHQGRLIGAICAAPLLLLEAGVLAADGSAAPYTAHPSTASELPAADAAQAVVVATTRQPIAPNTQPTANGTQLTANSAQPIALNTQPTQLVTSRGAGTSTLFALTLLEQVLGGEVGRKQAAEVAAAICLGAAQ